MAADSSSFASVLPAALVAVARGGISGSQERLSHPLRELHRVLLRSYMTSGGTVTVPAAAALAAELGLDPENALRLLEEADLMHTEGTNRVMVLHPFVSHDAVHKVELRGYPTLSAACAIDALGAFFMANTDGVLRSADTLTGTPVTIERSGETWSRKPAGLAVVLCATEGCSGPIIAACATTGFHRSHESAQRYLRTASPKVAGKILTWDEAIALAAAEFGSLLGGAAQQS